jgi:hypothetical protein
MTDPNGAIKEEIKDLCRFKKHLMTAMSDLREMANRDDFKAYTEDLRELARDIGEVRSRIVDMLEEFGYEPGKLHRRQE